MSEANKYYCFPEGTKDLKSTALYDDEIETLEIPASIESITCGLTDECPNLRTVKFAKHAKLEDINFAVFEGCPNLQEIIVPEEDEEWRTVDGAVYSRDGVLLMCPQGKSGRFVVEEGTKIIGRCAFSGCAKLEEIVLPDSLEGIYPQAFEFCTGLRRLVLPEGLNFFNGGCFVGCDERLFNSKDGCRYLPSARNDFFAWVGLDDDAVSAKVSDKLEFVADFPETPLSSPFVSDKLKEIVLPSGEKGEMCRNYLWEETMKLVKYDTP